MLVHLLKYPLGCIWLGLCTCLLFRSFFSSSHHRHHSSAVIFSEYLSMFYDSISVGNPFIPSVMYLLYKIERGFSFRLYESINVWGFWVFFFWNTWILSVFALVFHFDVLISRWLVSLVLKCIIPQYFRISSQMDKIDFVTFLIGKPKRTVEELCK